MKLTAIVRRELVEVLKFIVKHVCVCVCLCHTHVVCMQVYVWGEIPQLQNDDKTPMETNLQSLDEVFSVYGDGTMYRTLKIGTPILYISLASLKHSPFCNY